MFAFIKDRKWIIYLIINLNISNTKKREKGNDKAIRLDIPEKDKYSEQPMQIDIDGIAFSNIVYADWERSCPLNSIA